MARPIKTKSEVHRKTMQVRVRDKQLELFRQAAEKFGLDVSAWVRERLIQAAKRDLRD